VEVALYIEAIMEPAASHQPTSICYRWCLVMMEAVIALHILVLMWLSWYMLWQRLLQRRLLLLSAKDIYGLVQLCLPCSFFIDLLLHDLNSLHRCPSFGHMFLLEPEALIFLVKSCELVFYNDFDFLFRILVLVAASFDFVLWVLVVLWWLL
jgi:hypothetical protein